MPEHFIRGQLGPDMRRARQTRQLSLRALEARTRVSFGYLSNLEGGSNRYHGRLLPPLAAAFDLPPLQLALRGLHERFTGVVAGFLAPIMPSWRSDGYRFELRRPDGSLLSA
jgi:transcriptional regulator with XRE-family HTH domain